MPLSWQAIPRWDKYESKLLYWVEEELEAEVETQRSRVKRQTIEYEVDTAVADGLGEFNAPLTLNANEMKNGLEGGNGRCFSLTYIVIFK